MSAVTLIEEAASGWPSAATEDVTKPSTIEDLRRQEIRERMSGNRVAARAIPTLLQRSLKQQGGSVNIHPFTLSRAGQFQRRSLRMPVTLISP